MSDEHAQRVFWLSCTCLKGMVDRSDLEDDWLRAFEDKQVDGEELRLLYSAFRSDVTGF